MIYGEFGMTLRLFACANGETVEAKLLVGSHEATSLFLTPWENESEPAFRARVLAHLMRKLDRKLDSE